MPAVATTASLIEGLQQGDLLTASQKEQVKELAAAFPEPKALAQELARRGWLTIFQAKQALLGRAAGLTLGPYVVLDSLGGGGAGQVYKALHRKMDRVVALKTLRSDVRTDGAAVQRFYREIEVASQLSHPNIVHAYEAGPIGQLLVLVMEHVDGQDLDQIVKKSGPLPILQACDYIRQAAVGLQYAHERGLIHRDVKPSNLLVSKAQGSRPQGLVKILDLGLARLQEPLEGSTTANITIDGGNVGMQGTPDYLSPEQALDFHAADIRSDIYSLGCTLYFLLAGKAPFPGNTLAEKLMKHQQAEMPPVGRDLPPGLVKLLRKMLAKRPEDRYQTPGEVAEALAAIAAGKPKGLEPETVTEQAPPRTTPALALDAPSMVRRRKRRLAAGVAAAAVLAGAAALLFAFAGAGEPESPTPSTPTVEHTIPEKAPELVTIASVSTKKRYTLLAARVGEKHRIDRVFKITLLSPALENCVLICAANDDKQVKVAEHLSLVLGAPATVYIAYDKREKVLPAWLTDGSWKLTAEKFGADGGEVNASPFKVFVKSFPAGRLTLGGNQAPPTPSASTFSHYVVIVKPSE